MNTTNTETVVITATKKTRGRKNGSPNTIYSIPVEKLVEMKINVVPLTKKVAIKLLGADVAKIANGEPVDTARSESSSIGITVIG